MRLNTHLSFNGQCEEAFQRYRTIFGGKILTMMPYEGSPHADQVPAGWRNKILHATLEIGDQIVMGADTPSEQFASPQGFSVVVGVSDADEAERIFKALADKGTIQLPLQETFWAVRFGMVVDQYDIPWMINCGKGQ